MIKLRKKIDGRKRDFQTARFNRVSSRRWHRGNYRSDVFATDGACDAFEAVLAATCVRFDWRIHAYVIMRNHFHLALETLHPNLADGMHWLQGTYAVRFNRFRKEQGHVFQGRYRALLIENSATLARVADYVHLNPVRAHVLAPAEIAAYRWGSLRHFRSAERPRWLTAVDLLRQHGLSDDEEGWTNYVKGLAALAIDKEEQQRLGFDGMSTGWAIGTTGWRRAVARDYDDMKLAVGMERKELQSLKEALWAAALAVELSQRKRRHGDLEKDKKGAQWKREIAVALRTTSGASYAWLARTLEMGRPESVRLYVCQARANLTF